MLTVYSCIVQLKWLQHYACVHYGWTVYYITTNVIFGQLNHRFRSYPHSTRKKLPQWKPQWKNLSLKNQELLSLKSGKEGPPPRMIPQAAMP